MANYIKDSNYGPDQAKWTIDFDPNKYDKIEDAAKAFHEALQVVVAAHGQQPNVECGILTPEQAPNHGYGNVWVVWWEAGPYEWGIVASMEFMFNRMAGWYTEPHYSFDLTFVE